MFAVRSFNEVPFHRGPFPHILLLMEQKIIFVTKDIPRMLQKRRMGSAQQAQGTGKQWENEK